MKILNVSRYEEVEIVLKLNEDFSRSDLRKFMGKETHKL